MYCSHLHNLSPPATRHQWAHVTLHVGILLTCLHGAWSSEQWAVIRTEIGCVLYKPFYCVTLLIAHAQLLHMHTHTQARTTQAYIVIYTYCHITHTHTHTHTHTYKHCCSFMHFNLFSTRYHHTASVSTFYGLRESLSLLAEQVCLHLLLVPAHF